MSDSLEAKSLTSAVNFACICELTPSAASIKSTMPSDSLTADVTSSEKFTWPEEEYESLIICFCTAVCKYTVYLYFYKWNFKHMSATAQGRWREGRKYLACPWCWRGRICPGSQVAPWLQEYSWCQLPSMTKHKNMIEWNYQYHKNTR